MNARRRRDLLASVNAAQQQRPTLARHPEPRAPFTNARPSPSSIPRLRAAAAANPRNVWTRRRLYRALEAAVPDFHPHRRRLHHLAPALSPDQALALLDQLRQPHRTPGSGRQPFPRPLLAIVLDAAPLPLHQLLNITAADLLALPLPTYHLRHIARLLHNQPAGAQPLRTPRSALYLAIDRAAQRIGIPHANYKLLRNALIIRLLDSRVPLEVIATVSGLSFGHLQRHYLPCAVEHLRPIITTALANARNPDYHGLELPDPAYS